jgi:alkyl sulfatase BDS1-like metallo-beta-lactamase superfamily hydrolase
VSARTPTSERLRGVASKLVSRRSDDQLSRLERGPQRRVVLETIFAGMRRRFDAEAAGDLDAVAAFCVEPGERYTVAIRDGSCTVVRGAGERAQVTFTLGAADLLRLATGAERWTDLLGARRIALAGDPFLALRVIGAFGLSGPR